MDPSSLPPTIDLSIPIAAPPPPPSVPSPLPATATIANPTPPTINHKNHPAYSEMIYAAITALNEKGGSSKRAIAKYIEKAYTNLPTTHSAVLTQHLKRLKNSGFLVMVKKSYKLPRSDAIIPPNDVVINNSNPNPTTAAVATTAANGSLAHGPKTGRGRGRPRKLSTGSGLVVEKPERGPGRPRKTDVNIPVQRGPKKKMVGRPRKPKTVKGRPVQVQLLAQDQLNPVAVSFVTTDSNVLVPVSVPGPAVPRPRGRPRKIGTSADAGGKQRGRPPKKLKSSTGRPVGRPKKNISSALTKAAETQVQTIADLKKKLEYFQSKVKQVVGVLKPQLNSQSQISAVATIRELEGLASIDINVPLKEDTQPQPWPQPQLQTQPQSGVHS